MSKEKPTMEHFALQFKVHPPLVILWEKKERESVLELALCSNYFTICFKLKGNNPRTILRGSDLSKCCTARILKRMIQEQILAFSVRSHVVFFSSF